MLAGVSTHMRKGKWLSYPFQLLSPPQPPAFMNGFPLARMYISSSNTEISELSLMSPLHGLVIAKKTYQARQALSRLNQNPQEAQTKNGNQQNIVWTKIIIT